MQKVKYLFSIVALVALFYSCKRSEPVENFDPNPQFTLDTNAIRSFIVKNNLSMTKDPSGVFYQILNQGSGNTITTRSLISVDYAGKFLGGDEFESTNGKPVEFPLGNLIAGWQIGLQKIQKGGKIRLLIPSYFAYGSQAAGKIPPNTPLDFTITVTDVK